MHTPERGLYKDSYERDSCGFGLIASLDDAASHWLVRTAITSLNRLTHRGAIRQHGDHQAARLTQLGERTCPLAWHRAAEALERRRVRIGRHKLIAGCNEVPSHRCAHVAEPDKSDACWRYKFL